MGKFTKNKKVLYFLITIALIFSTIFSSIIIAKNYFYYNQDNIIQEIDTHEQLNRQNIDKEQSDINNQQTRDWIQSSSPVVVNNDMTLSLPSPIHNDYYYANVATRNGFFLTLRDRAIMLDHNTFSIKWTLHETVGHDYGKRNGRRVLASAYDEIQNVLILIVDFDRNTKVLKINPNNGSLLNSSDLILFNNNSNRRIFLSRASDDSWVVSSQYFAQYGAARVVLFWTARNNINNAPRSYNLRSWQEEDNTILGLGGHYVPGNATYFFLLSRRRVYIYKEDKKVATYDSSPLRNSNPDFKTLSQGVFTNAYGTIIEFGIIDNSDPFHCKAYVYAFDYKTNRIRRYEKTLDNGSSDYDIKLSRYDNILKQFITYNTYSSKGGYASTGFFNFSYFDSKNFREGQNDGVTLYYYPSGSFNNNSSLIQIPLKDAGRNGNIFSFVVNDNRFIPIDDNKKEFDNRNSSTAYNTDVITSSWTTELDGVSEIKITNDNFDDVVNRIQENKLLTKNNINFYQSNSSFSLSNIRSFTDQLEYIYKGLVSTELNITNAFVNGARRNRSFSWYNFGGFKKWTTTLTKCKFDSIVGWFEKDASLEIIKDVLFNRRDEYFLDLPYDFTKDNMNIVKAEFGNDNNALITITINKWINHEGILQTSDKKIQLMFGNVSTEVYNSTIDGSSLNMTPERLQTIIGNNASADQEAFSTLHTWMQDNYENFLKFVPNVDGKDNFISFINDKGNFVSKTSNSITFDFTVDPIYVDGNHIEGEDLTSEYYKKFQITINNLLEYKNTTMKGGVDHYSISVADTPLGQYTPYQIQEVIGTSSNTNKVVFNALKTWMQTNYQQFLDNVPNIEEGNDDFISFINDTGEYVGSTSDSITFKFTVNPIFIEGYEIKGWQHIKEKGYYKHFQITLTDLTNGDTKVKPENTPENTGFNVTETSLANYSAQKIQRILNGDNDEEKETIKVIIRELIDRLFDFPYVSNSWKSVFDVQFVRIENGDTNKPNTIILKILFDHWYENGKKVQKSSSNAYKSFDVKFINLKYTGETMVKEEYRPDSTGFDVTDTVLANYAPYEIKNMSERKPDEQAYQKLLTDIRSVIERIFDNFYSHQSWKSLADVTVIDILDSTSMTITLRLDHYYDSESELHDSYKNFEVKLINLRNGDTQFRESEYGQNADGYSVVGKTLANYSPFQIKKILEQGTDDEIENIKNAVRQVIPEIFYNPVLENSWKSLISVEFVSIPDETEPMPNKLVLRLNVDYIYENGKKRYYGGNSNTPFKYVVKFTNLLFKKTIIKPEFQPNSTGYPVDQKSVFANYAPYELADIANNPEHEKRQELFENVRNLPINDLFVNFIENGSWKSLANVYNATVIDSTTIEWDLRIDKYYNEYGEVISGRKDFRVKFTNLANKDTKLKTDVESNGITVDGELTNFVVTDLIGPTQIPSKVQQLKEWIFDNRIKIFDFLPSTLTSVNDNILDFNIKPVEGDNTSVNVSFRIKPVYKNGQFNEEGETFSFKVKGFSEKTLWTIAKTDVVVDVSSTSSDIFASQYTQDIATVVTNEINSKKETYFENLPDLTAEEKIIIIGTPVVDNELGKIYVNYQLPKFYVNNQIQTPSNPTNNPNAIIYQATISGFKTELNSIFAGMDKSINVGQLNPTVTSNALVGGDYLTPIKNHISSYLDSNNTLLPPTDLENTKNAVSSLSNENIKLYKKNNQWYASVTSSEIASASRDENWNSGYVFTLNGATYLNTSINVSEEKTNLEISLSQFNQLSTNKDKLLKLNTTLNNLHPASFKAENPEYDNPDQLTISAKGDEIKGLAVVSIVFPKIYLNDSVVDNYTYSFNFQFKSSAIITNNNYLTDDVISVNNINSEWNTDIITAYKKILDGGSGFDWNSKKNGLKHASIDVAKIKNISFVSVSYNATDSNNVLDITLRVENNEGNMSNEIIKVNGFASTTPITKTNPIASNSIIGQLEWEQLEQKVRESGKTKGAFLDWTDGKIPTTNEAIAISQILIEEKQDINTVTPMKVAFVNFKFNGIYLENNINSFVSNYVVKLKIEFSASTLLATHSEIVWEGSSDAYVDITNINKENNNWIIAIVFLSLLLCITCIVVYYIIKERKLNKKNINNERSKTK